MNKDVIFYNGSILTMDLDNPNTEAILVRNNKIMALGHKDDLCQLASPQLEMFDLQGECLMPGFHDSHVHLLYHGFSLAQLDLEKTKTKAEALALVAKKANKLAEGSWILGAGYLLSRWGEEINKKDLDDVAPKHYVVLRSQDHHSAWLNSLALQIAGINKSTPKPEHGEILRDANGEITGVLLEHAYDLVAQKLPKPSNQELVKALDNAADDLASYGITTVHHMAYEPAQFWRVLAKEASKDNFPIRVWACIDQDRIEAASEIGLATAQGGNNFQIGGAKFFADGALGSKTSHMLEPFDNSTNYGTEVHGYEILIDRFPKAIAAGLVPVIHAIGDAANRAVLDALAETKELWQAQNMRPRIEHAQHLHSQDIIRFAELGVIASMQPIHLRFDAKTALDLLGERAANMHNWRSLLASGASLAFGSDTPVAIPDVIEALKTGLDRKAESGEELYPEQALKIEELLHAYTRNAAYAINWENRSGQLKAGYDADFVILSHNPYEGLEDLKVVATMKGGLWTFYSW